MTAVLDSEGNPEVFYISALPMEGFENLCPYLNSWPQANVGSDSSGDYMVGPDG